MTESADTRGRRLAAALQLRMLMANVAVGVLAGLAVAHLRLGLGLPGHKLLLWMTPVIVARLLSGHPFGAAAGSLAAAATSLALGGNLAGDLLYLPLVGVAGASTDAFLVFAGWRHLPDWLLVPLAGLGGMTGGLVCALKRLLVPVVHVHAFFGLPGPATRPLSYAVFGLLAGLVGATVAVSIRRLTRKSETPPSIRTS